MNFDLKNCSIQRKVTCRNVEDLEPIHFKAQFNEITDKYFYNSSITDFIQNGTLLKCQDGICKHFSLEYECDVQDYVLENYLLKNKCNCNDCINECNKDLQLYFDEECPRGEISCLKVNKFFKPVPKFKIKILQIFSFQISSIFLLPKNSKIL